MYQKPAQQMRVTFAAVLLISACASHSRVGSPWVEFAFLSGLGVLGSINGQISSTGAVQVHAIRRHDGRRATLEKQLRPSEMGQVRKAIAAHIEHFGPSTNVRTNIMDASGFKILVRDGENVRLSFYLHDACHETHDENEYVLWNAIMRATRAPEYDTRGHIIECR